MVGDNFAESFRREWLSDVPTIWTKEVVDVLDQNETDVYLANDPMLEITALETNFSLDS